MPTSGDILLNGKDISQLPPYERPINTVFQRYALFPHMNIFDNIAFGLKLKKLPADEIKKKVKKVLELVDLEGFEKRSVSTLSGGQQQRVGIARAIAVNPDVILFDEPTSALDPELTGEVLNVIRQLAAEGTTMVIVTHEMTFARDTANHIIFMDKDQIIEEGPASEIFTSPKEARTRQFLQRLES
jgi:spermidine/putrescine transport system ATP-binding protein